jgi:hypothetical protein|tara:strand:+ start:100 stop:717 length:618 start_codon:yes stop_codon:yes gene_type:complete
MANRVLLGKRGSNYGLYVSSPGVDVTDTTATGGLIFSSDAAANNYAHAYGQGSLTATTTYRSGTPSSEWDSGDGSTVRIAHGLGYAPQVFMRWCYGHDLYTYSSGDGATVFNGTSGKYAMTSFTPGMSVSSLTASYSSTYECNTQIGYGCDMEITNDYIYIVNYESGGKGLIATGASNAQETKFTGLTIYYAYITTKAPNNGLNY